MNVINQDIGDPIALFQNCTEKPLYSYVFAPAQMSIFGIYHINCMSYFVDFIHFNEFYDKKLPCESIWGLSLAWV